MLSVQNIPVWWPFLLSLFPMEVGYLGCLCFALSIVLGRCWRSIANSVRVRGVCLQRGSLGAAFTLSPEVRTAMRWEQTPERHLNLFQRASTWRTKDNGSWGTPSVLHIHRYTHAFWYRSNLNALILFSRYSIHASNRFVQNIKWPVNKNVHFLLYTHEVKNNWRFHRDYKSKGDEKWICLSYL